MHAYDRGPHLLSLHLSLDVFGRILAISSLGSLFSLWPTLWNLLFLAISHKLAASWLAQANHFFPVFASVRLKSMSFWDRGLSWLLGHLGNHDIYRLSRTGLGERTENSWRGSQVSHEEVGGLIYLEVIATKLRNEKWYGGWWKENISKTNFHLIFHWNVSRTHAPPFSSGVLPAVPVYRDHSGFLFSFS